MMLAMDAYQINLGGLLALCVTIYSIQKLMADAEAKDNKKNEKIVVSKDASQTAFLIVYSLVMGADWLQVRGNQLGRQ
jgi:hypothetical protein